MRTCPVYGEPLSAERVIRLLLFRVELWGKVRPIPFHWACVKAGKPIAKRVKIK